MKKQFYFFCSLLFFFFALIVFPQNPQWELYTNSDHITCIADEGNYLWIGTGGGLFKLNKTTKEKIFYNTVNSGLTSNYITSIAIDGNGNKWIGTKDGRLAMFDGTNWSIYDMCTVFGYSCDYYDYYYVTSITFDDNGNLWVGEYGRGVAVFNGTNWIVYNYSNSELPTNYVNTLFNDNNGNIWIGTRFGLAVFDGTNWTIYDTELPSDTVFCISKDKNDNIWVGTGNGLAKLDADTWVWSVFDTSNSDLPSNVVHSVAVDDIGNVWIANNGGLSIYDGSNWITYNTANSDLPSDNIYSIIIDSNNVKWLITTFYVIEFNGITWNKYSTSTSGLPSNNLTCHFVFDKNGNRWIGSYGYGLIKFDGTNWTIYNTSNSGLPYNGISAMTTDKYGNIWIGTYYGLVKFNGENWIVYNTSNSGLPNNVIYSLAIDTSDNIWIGTSSDLVLFDGPHWITFNFGCAINSIAIDKSECLWVGTYGQGVKKFDGTSWTTYTSGNSSLLYNYIYSLIVDGNSNIWVGTHGYGVGMFNGTDWLKYNTSNSDLPDNIVHDIAVDGNNDLWIGTNNEGLIKFDGANWTVYNNPNSGLPSNKVVSLGIENNYTIWIGTLSDGLAVYKENGIVPLDQFSEQTIPLSGVEFSSASWGDYDNDGDLDILIAGGTDAESITKIYKNNGGYSFIEQSANIVGVWGSTEWGDYNNDGYLDILVTGFSNGSGRHAKIYKNNGNGSFSEIALIPSGIEYCSAAWGDYDNDGDLDILLTGEIDIDVFVSKIFRNDGNDIFTETSIPLTNVRYGSVAWGDYDNDGDLDILLTGDIGTGEVSKIYSNNGFGSFTELSVSLTGVKNSSVAWGDYNNDNYLDILLIGENSSEGLVTKIYQNNGDSTFTNISASLPGFHLGSAAWGDYDNDGNLDILLTGSSTEGIATKIYRNNGNGTFAETSISLKGVSLSSAAWGDYDNDGDLDILLSGKTENEERVTKIYRNNNEKLNTPPVSPANLLSSVNGNEVFLSWDRGSDSETPQNGLNYNLVIGTIPNGINTISPMSDRSSGYRRVVSLGNTNHTTSYTIRDLPIGDYYWSVQTIDNTFAGSPFAEEQSFTISSLTGPHFTKVWSGNPYHPMNIYVTSAKLDGADLEAEDEIAVFDGDICVASAILNSPIPSGGYIPLIASTDDPTTAEVDGFVEGDTITFKIWDSGNSKEINRITAKYTQGTAKFESQGTALVDLEGIITITQNIELSAGWNLFSLMIEPGNPNLQQILNPLIDSDVLVKVQDEAGNAIEELTGIGWINDIGNWSSTEGYYLKANGDTTLTLTDPPVQLPLSVPLTNSWNIISYPVDTEQDAMEVLNDLITADQLVKVQDENGNAIEYLPEPAGWVNYIGNFKGDEGYYLKANTVTTLTIDEPIPAPIAKRTNKANQNKTILKTALNHFVPAYTGNAYLAMNIYVTSVSLSDGGNLGLNDEIGIFDGDICVGAYVLTGPIDQLISMKASTDDPTTTAIDGFTPGHVISYKFWLSAESKEVTNYTAVYSAGVGIFSSQGTAVLSFTELLPVELVLFSAEENNNQITLNWETATEKNNYGFEVQRQVSSKETTIEYQDNQKSSVKNQKWEKIGFVQGNGNSNSVKRYQFVDKRLFGGNKFSYRLKQIDTDGKFSYTKEIEIEAIPKEYSLSQNYPNPFNPITSIEFQIVNPGLVTLKVYDILGNEVATILNKEFEPGYYKYQWNGSGIASGVYFYRIKSGNFSQVKKMILMK